MTGSDRANGPGPDEPGEGDEAVADDRPQVRFEPGAVRDRERRVETPWGRREVPPKSDVDGNRERSSQTPITSRDAAKTADAGRSAAFAVDLAEEPSSVDSIRILVTCVLAWAVPGLGHIAAGRFARGLLFGLIVLALFAGGIGLHGKVYRPEQGEPLTYLAAVGAAGVGLPYVAAHAVGLGFGDIRTQGYEYGNTFTLVAGLLNLLIVLDAYDVASGRR